MTRTAIHSFLLVILAAPTALADDAATITTSGYVETYYQVNLRFPDDHVTALRANDGRERSFTLSNAVLGASGERGPLAVKIALQVGSTGAGYYAAEPPEGGGPELWRYLQQATLAYSTPGKIVVDAGLFPSPIGPEVIPIKDNWNWSRSDLFFALPAYHTGARIAVPLGRGWTAQAHVYNGWNSVVDGNDSPSVGASAAYAGTRVQGQVLYFGGLERDTWRHLFDAYATATLADRASMLVHADAGFEASGAAWAAGAVYGKVDLSGCVYAAARADVFREWVPDGAVPIFWPTTWVSSGTATAAWQPAEGLSARLELRHDHAAGGAYAGHHTQNTVTLGATAWF